jgi:hypothetical protein
MLHKAYIAFSMHTCIAFIPYTSYIRAGPLPELLSVLANRPNDLVHNVSRSISSRDQPHNSVIHNTVRQSYRLTYRQTVCQLDIE